MAYQPCCHVGDPLRVETGTDDLHRYHLQLAYRRDWPVATSKPGGMKTTSSHFEDESSCIIDYVLTQISVHEIQRKNAEIQVTISRSQNILANPWGWNIQIQSIPTRFSYLHPSYYIFKNSNLQDQVKSWYLEAWTCLKFWHRMDTTI